MAFSGKLSDDGDTIAYSPLAPAFSFDFTSYVAWGNYRGGRAGTIWLTPSPASIRPRSRISRRPTSRPSGSAARSISCPAATGRSASSATIRRTRLSAQVYRNTGPDIRSLATDGSTLIFDRLGELYTLVPGQEPQRLAVDVEGDMPDVRARILNVGDQVENIRISPTGLRAVVEAHGEILTLPVKEGVVRNLTSSPGVMEREPAWSPDGQSIAYFSDEDGLYALHVASQTRRVRRGCANTSSRPNRLIISIRSGRRIPRRSPSTTTSSTPRSSTQSPAS